MLIKVRGEKDMKKLISICIAVFLGINIVTSCSIVTADSIEAKYTYTIQDVQNLQNYLLTKPTKDNLAEKPYDLMMTMCGMYLTFA